eukprot:CAMPEP_0194504638 /NCGR_PEP_ID=MMETSP0253-20130528/29060_1 /TAXON_ID=2966 /ORGANISM="Noctiluca scintillans" /LENGTH=100 /DNA_ID=CAMNT_0039347057 /DNA_START=52 /DNA_END=354 /DNA_ORIENTATION=+
MGCTSTKTVKTTRTTGKPCTSRIAAKYAVGGGAVGFIGGGVAMDHFADAGLVEAGGEVLVAAVEDVVQTVTEVCDAVTEDAVDWIGDALGDAGDAVLGLF